MTELQTILYRAAKIGAIPLLKNGAIPLLKNGAIPLLKTGVIQKTKTGVIQKTKTGVIRSSRTPRSDVKIMNAIRKNHVITRQELMKVTGLSRNGVEWQIRKLREAGKLDRVGTTRKGFWVILEEQNKE